MTTTWLIYLTDLLINQEVHFRSEGASETVQRNLISVYMKVLLYVE